MLLNRLPPIQPREKLTASSAFRMVLRHRARTQDGNWGEANLLLHSQAPQPTRFGHYGMRQWKLEGDLLPLFSFLLKDWMD